MHFPVRAASILFLSIFWHKIGVLKSVTLFLPRKRIASYMLQGHVHLQKIKVCFYLSSNSTARAALLTGRLPIRNGFYTTNAHARNGKFYIDRLFHLHY